LVGVGSGVLVGVGVGGGVLVGVDVGGIGVGVGLGGIGVGVSVGIGVSVAVGVGIFVAVGGRVGPSWYPGPARLGAGDLGQGLGASLQDPEGSAVIVAITSRAAWV